MGDDLMTPFERDVIERIVQESGVHEQELRAQLPALRVRKRDEDAGGLWLRFDTNAFSGARSHWSGELGRVMAILADEPRLGFVLWISDGVISELEGFTYPAVDWPMDKSGLVLTGFEPGSTPYRPTWSSIWRTWRGR